MAATNIMFKIKQRAAVGVEGGGKNAMNIFNAVNSHSLGSNLSM